MHFHTSFIYTYMEKMLVLKEKPTMLIESDKSNNK